MNVGANAYPVAMLHQVVAVDHADQAKGSDTRPLSRNKRGVAEKYSLWPQFSTIRISLVGMTKEQEEFTKNNINKWAPHVNLKFEFIDQPHGDIRIAADNQLQGGYSAVGTRAIDEVKSNEPTMMIGFKGGFNEYNAGTITHEFGHVLGLEHEHQHPESNIDFNWGNVRKNYRDNSFVESNYGPLAGEVVTSDYDRESVMHYPIPSSYLRSGSPVGENNDLSEGDKEFARTLYPPIKNKEDGPFSDFSPIAPFMVFARTLHWVGQNSVAKDTGPAT